MKRRSSCSSTSRRRTGSGRISQVSTQRARARLAVAIGAADMDHQHGFRPEFHQVQHLGLGGQVPDALLDQVRIGAVQHDELRGVERQADVRAASPCRRSPAARPPLSAPCRGIAACRDAWRRARGRTTSGTSGCRGGRDSRGCASTYSERHLQVRVAGPAAGVVALQVGPAPITLTAKPSRIGRAFIVDLSIGSRYRSDRKNKVRRQQPPTRFNH